MRITLQLLKKAAACSPEEATYLDLSSRNIVDLEKLDSCTRVQTLVLRENCLAVVRDIECCRELWNIDLTGNKVRGLHGLSRFPVLGSLLLGYNALEWQDLQRLMHIHLLRFTLAGCANLDSDPNYRAHIINILPNLWMLDGQLITAGERKQVKQFFKDTASSAHPVRPKLSSASLFTPSNLKNLIVTGVYGERTTHMMTRFPLRYSHNIDLDRKRLMYLSCCMEKDLELENQYLERKEDATFRVPGLQKLLETRSSTTEQCNMLLLLLAARLEFKLPFKLMESTLETARLSHIEGIACAELFQLPDHVVLNVISLLFSAASIDREGSKEGGLYDQLYQCLQYTLYSLHRKVLAPTTNTSSNSSSSSLSRAPSSRKVRHTVQHHHRCLLASEVVHLMCLVPTFFDALIEADQGVTELVSAATRNSRVGATIGELTWKVHNRGGDIWDLYQDIASYLLQETSDKILSKKGKFPVPSKPVSVHSMQHTTSQIIQQPQASRWSTQPPRAQSAGSHHKYYPGLGDSVLCSPQKVARIVALPEGHVAVLQLSQTGSMTPPQDSYFYVDTRGLIWDSTQGYWTRDDLSAELSSSILMPSPELTRRQGGHTTSLPPSRPYSQMSNYSEDLHALSSVEEVLLGEGSLEGERFHMSVNIMDRSTSSPTRRRPYTPEQLEEVKLLHQSHVLQQYRDTSPANKPAGYQDISPTHEDQTASVRDEVPGVSPSLASLSVPTPQLNFPSTWKSTTSIPSPHPVSHACEREPRPTSSLGDRESLPGSTIDLSPFHEQRPPAVLQAWTAPTASHQPKTTMLTAARRRPSAPTDRRQKHTSSSTQVKSAGGVRGTSSSSLSLSRPSSRQSSSAVVLHPRSSSTSLSSTSSISSSYPLHMSAYLQHSRTEHTKHRFQPRPQTGGKVHGTRKLGDLRHLTVLGSSAW